MLGYKALVLVNNVLDFVIASPSFVLSSVTDWEIVGKMEVTESLYLNI